MQKFHKLQQQLESPQLCFHIKLLALIELIYQVCEHEKKCNAFCAHYTKSLLNRRNISIYKPDLFQDEVNSKLVLANCFYSFIHS